MTTQRKHCFKIAKRIVVKVGSNVLAEDDGLNLNIIRSFSRQIFQLTEKGVEVILVSSGAMAAGLRKIGLSKKPDDIPQRQAVAAVGQAGLIMEYEKAFEQYGKKVAQILLTGDGLYQRKRYLNARNTLNTLLSWQIIPIINENDTVAVEEIKFGDNDNLSAMIALLMNADMLIILSDIEGLYNKDPRISKDAKLIPMVSAIKRNIEQFAGESHGELGTGGMLTKIRAARKVNTAGIPMVIAKGTEKNILLRLFEGEELGTFFIPKPEKMASRKCWIGFTAKPKGILHIDDGAVKAILEKGKSLLPIGIVGVKGEFGVGAAVEFRNSSDEALGIGIVNYSAADIRKIMRLKTSEIQDVLGEKSYDEVIHRNNLVLTGECMMEE